MIAAATATATATVVAIASASAACAGCHGDARAQPETQVTAVGTATSGVTMPTGWTVLPAIADAVAAAASAPGIVVDGVEAWGEPAMGCYAAWVRMHGGAADVAPEVIAKQIADGFGSGGGNASSSSSGSGVSGGGGRVTVEFARAPYRGRVRADVTAGSVSALACFANQREPAACTAACDAMLGAK
jgi:uncharacterized membrane protein YgcG